MFKLPKNDPRDVEFIKKAHQDPNWPEDLDKPCDWDNVSLWRKVWFRVGDTVIMLTTVTVIMALIIACHEAFFDGEAILDEPRCEKSSRGCVDY